jgi:predicted nucleic acid-binding protein
VIVVDTNVVAYLYLPGAYTDDAEALLARDPEWSAPVLWRSEFRNILAGYLRRRVLTFDQVLDTQAEAEGLMADGEHDVDSSGVLELVRDSACSAYDCEFVHLARTLGVRLVTMDAALLRAFPKYTRSLRPS